MMSQTVDQETGRKLLAPDFHPTLWTVLIAAAGRGTRLGFDKPKILFPVGNRTILERLVQLFDPIASQFVFVVSPAGAPVVEPEAQQLLGDRVRVAVQPSPLGMGHAIACGLPLAKTEYTAIVWGDQFALKRSSLEFCARLLEGPAQPDAVCPTLLRTNPYIHFERDPESGRIVAVLQKREGDILPETGESDSGVFFFRTAALKQFVPHLLASGESMLGRTTKEINFLPIFPMLDASGHLITARIMTEAESVGINSRDDAKYLEALTDHDHQ